jgi:hypothetical protein
MKFWDVVGAVVVGSAITGAAGMIIAYGIGRLKAAA